MELYNKYRPTTFDEVVGNDVAIKTIKKELENGTHVFLFTGSAGTGKAQPLDSLILTKNGYIRMGDVKVGTKILDGKGNETEVIGVYPQGSRDIYNITFMDRTSIRVSDEHINRVYIDKVFDDGLVQYGCMEDLSTLELIEKFKAGLRISVDTPKIDCWEKTELPLHPFLYGFFLSNNFSISTFRFTIVREDIKAKLYNLLTEIKCDLSYIGNYEYEIVGDEQSINELKLTIKTLCVKPYIHKMYLYNSLNNRLELLKGLTQGSNSFDTNKQTLSENFAFLVRSLGIFDLVKFYSDGDFVYYSHNLYDPNSYCAFVNKLEFIKREIISIKKVSNEECQCIYVSSDEHTYITDNFTVTHNTTLSRIIAKEIGADDLSTIEINTADNRGIDTAREILEQMKYKSLGKNTMYILDEIHAVNNIFQNSILKALEEVPEHVYFCLCTTEPHKLIEPLKSRCSIINIKPLSFDDMCYLIKRTARSEKIKLSDNIIEEIANLSDGASRKALKLLAKVLYLDDDKERMEALKGYTEEDDAEITELCRAFLKENVTLNNLTSILKKIDLTDAERIRRSVMAYMNTIIMSGKRNLKAEAVMQAFSEAKTYANGKYAITVALLDFLSMLG